jgi:hypothetical protein
VSALSVCRPERKIKEVTNLRESSDSDDSISQIFHHDDGTSTETGLSIFKTVEIDPVSCVRVGF